MAKICSGFCSIELGFYSGFVRCINLVFLIMFVGDQSDYFTVEVSIVGFSLAVA